MHGAATLATDLTAIEADESGDHLSQRPRARYRSLHPGCRGFNFLCCNLMSGVRIYTYPSKKSLLSVMNRVRTLTRRKLRRKLADLLRRLNPVLQGWCNYFRHGVCKQTFGYVDHYTWWKIVAWIRKRHLGLNWGQSIGTFSLVGRSALMASICSGHNRLPLSATDTGQPNPHAMDEPDKRITPASGMTPWRAGCRGICTPGCMSSAWLC